MAVDYQIRCKRCGYPYYPNHIENRICIFCKKQDLNTRREKLESMIKSIHDYSKDRKISPIKDSVLKWTISRFDIKHITAKAYLRELINNKLVKVYNDGPYERVALA